MLDNDGLACLQADVEGHLIHHGLGSALLLQDLGIQASGGGNDISSSAANADHSNTDGKYSWDADEIEFATQWTDPSGVRVGDQIIWVTDKDGDVAFVVDLGSRTKATHGFDYDAPKWLQLIWLFTTRTV